MIRQGYIFKPKQRNLRKASLRLGGRALDMGGGVAGFAGFAGLDRGGEVMSVGGVVGV